MATMYRGICVDSADPRNLGRVRVRVPQVLGPLSSGWAYPSWGVGEAEVWPEDRLPKPGDGVWVSFESEDRMVWVGVFYKPEGPFHANPATGDPIDAPYLVGTTIDAPPIPVNGSVVQVRGTASSPTGVPPDCLLRVSHVDADGVEVAGADVAVDSDGNWAWPYTASVTPADTDQYKSVFLSSSTAAFTAADPTYATFWQPYVASALSDVVFAPQYRVPVTGTAKLTVATSSLLGDSSRIAVRELLDGAQVYLYREGIQLPSIIINDPVLVSDPEDPDYQDVVCNLSWQYTWPEGLLDAQDFTLRFPGGPVVDPAQVTVNVPAPDVPTTLALTAVPQEGDPLLTDVSVTLDSGAVPILSPATVRLDRNSGGGWQYPFTDDLTLTNGSWSGTISISPPVVDVRAVFDTVTPYTSSTSNVVSLSRNATPVLTWATTQSTQSLLYGSNHSYNVQFAISLRTSSGAPIQGVPASAFVVERSDTSGPYNWYSANPGGRIYGVDFTMAEYPNPGPTDRTHTFNVAPGDPSYMATPSSPRDAVHFRVRFLGHNGWLPVDGPPRSWSGGIKVPTPFLSQNAITLTSATFGWTIPDAHDTNYGYQPEITTSPLAAGYPKYPPIYLGAPPGQHTQTGIVDHTYVYIHKLQVQWAGYWWAWSDVASTTSFRTSTTHTWS